MGQFSLAFAFTAGIFATVNPCGWAMLPAFVSYYLGSREEGYAERPLIHRAFEGIYIGLLVTFGFVLVFGIAGIVISAGLQVITMYLPIMGLIVGIGLIALGVWLLIGKSLPFTLSTPNIELHGRNPKTIFLYGVAYAFASLSCTLPIFLAVVGTSLTASGIGAGAAMLGAYTAGMASVLMAIAMSMAIFKGAVAKRFSKFLPYVNRLGAVLLILAGIYVVWYQTDYLSLILA